MCSSSVRLGLNLESSRTSVGVGSSLWRIRDQGRWFLVANIMVDLAVDENGLWAIMAMKENNNTLVMKISSWNMELVWAWNITLNHNLVGDMFIVCGVLYAVDRTDARDTKIR